MAFRYFTVITIPGSFVSKLPFRTMKSALIWSIIIVTAVIIMNIHILVLSRKYEIDATEIVLFKNETFNLTKIEYSSFLLCYEYKTGYEIAPAWENVHMIIYNLIPFCVMTIFNGLLIKNVLLTSHISLHRHHNNNNSNTNNNSKPNPAQTKGQRKKRALTISLVFVTVLFLVMTLPSSIIFGFFYDFFSQNFGRSFLLIVDYLSFMNSSSIFFVSLLTNAKFRLVVFATLKGLYSSESEKMTKYAVPNTVQN